MMIDELLGDEQKQLRRTRLTLRVILTQLTACAVIATGFCVGAVAYLNSQATVQKLAGEVFSMEADYTYARVVEYSHAARHVLDLNVGLLRHQILDADLNILGAHFVDVLRANPRISTSGFGSPEGEAVWATKDTEGHVLVHTYSGHATGTIVHRTYEVSAEGKLKLKGQQSSDFDARARPWFRAAMDSDEPIWTPPFLYIPENVPGVTLATEAIDFEGRFVGVAFVDFDLRFLSRALKSISEKRPGAQGIIFDEAGNVLAHSDPLTTSRLARNGRRQVVKLEFHSDPVVRLLATKLDFINSNPSDRAEILHLDHGGEGYLVAVHQAHVAQEHTHLDWHVAVIVPDGLIVKEVREQAWLSFGIGVFILLLTLVVVVFISRRLSDGFYGFYAEMQRLGVLDLGEAHRTPTRILEVHELGNELDILRRSLRSFERYVSSALVRDLMSKGIEAVPGGRDEQVTIMFTDVEGFTSISEPLEPHELAVELSHNLEQASQIIAARRGTVDKYIGDSVMAFWNAPNPVPDHALQGCMAALEILNKVRDTQDTENPLWPIRIGVNTAVAMVGNLGSPSRLDYTVIGDGVNLASRIEGVNKTYGTRILIGESTRLAVSGELLTRPVDQVIVKGQSRPEPIHELIGVIATATNEERELADATQLAFAAYLEQRWDDAEAAYRLCLQHRPNDSVAELFIRRCQFLREQPPPPTWTGVYPAADDRSSLDGKK